MLSRVSGTVEILQVLHTEAWSSLSDSSATPDVHPTHPSFTIVEGQVRFCKVLFALLRLHVSV